MTLLEIIFKIRPVIEKLPFVHAMWLEGSYATGKFTANSDIDVWLDVDDRQFESTAQNFKVTLQQLDVLKNFSPLTEYSAEPKLAKAKFYLQDKTESQRIELDIQSHDRQFIFSRKEHAIVVLFDKDKTIRWRD